MPYSEIIFRGKCIEEENERKRKDGLIAASFTAWQTLSPKMSKPIEWGQYLKDLGLSDAPKVTKEDLEREAAASMANVEAIIARSMKKV